MAASVETRNLVGSALAVLLVGIAFAAVFRFMDQTQASAESRSKVNAALQTLERGISQLKDAETGQRGFLLTGRPEYLAPYETGRSQAAATLEAFTNAEGARQLPPQDLADLRSLTRAKFDELADTLRLA
ncbi:MAG TPA: CHASE3 domain-containing protein, partial [Holophagaceae bacterium]|nr:CHASE3 domain-containing protein [Holophagaceae bacterium]